MKKTLGVVAAATLAAMPVMGVFAVDNQFTDNISITIDEVCTLTRAASAHASGTDSGSWSTTGDTLSKTLTAGTAALDLGSSTFHVNCNHTSGYKVTMDAEGLASGTDNIPYIQTAAAPTVSTSEWAVKVGSNYILDNGVVDTTTAPLANAGKDFTVIYGVAIKDGQAAGTYAGTVTYTLATL